MAKVNVLLSTYDGERYLGEQLDSVLGQSQRDLVLHVRDDGSRDGTRALLRERAAQDTRMRVAEGENLGVVRSFFALLRDADPTCDHFAFSDQDDVWRQDKLACALEVLAPGEPGVPRLYCARAEVVDAALAPIGFSGLPRGIAFENALVQNVALGCTVVLNRAARDLLLSALPERALMHDWWAYLVVSAFGEVRFDPRPTLRYRQHGRNVVGGDLGHFRHYAKRAGRLLHAGRHAFRASDQARELARCFGDRLPPEARAALDAFLASKESLRRRLPYAWRPGVWRQSRIDDLLLRSLILAGAY